ncbi:MAG TPA: hypothetical protein PLD47_10210 [Aggregatilineales bacterium]|nr:hypothetical protein [Anaerolineales bacterium]HRE48087.1 hypothetical protein [Aggregatilineales bacterium]
MFQGLLPILGVGAIFLAAFLFWEAIQNWVADLIVRAAEQFKGLGYPLQSALVIVDRVVVNGQRMVAALARLTYRKSEDHLIHVEESRPVRTEDLPADVRAKLERGESYHYTIRK